MGGSPIRTQQGGGVALAFTKEGSGAPDLGVRRRGMELPFGQGRRRRGEFFLWKRKREKRLMKKREKRGRDD